MKKLVTLIIMDGFGLNKKEKGNAVKTAHTPNLDRYFSKYPNIALSASGLDVGLFAGQMGNSEVGHINIGAGRVVLQDSVRITKSIEEGEFFKNSELLKSIDYCKKNNTSLHLFGLLSDGGVHSLNSHLYALMKLAKTKGLKDVFIHCILDGRDVPPVSAKNYLKELEKKIKEIGVGKIATIMGRYFAMDRDSMWERVELVYKAMVDGKGETVQNWQEAISQSYEKKEYDEFVKPTVILNNDKPVAMVNEKDAIIFFNFRGDRAREITKSLVLEDEKFQHFTRDKGYFPVHFTCMTEYDYKLKNVNIAYKPVKIKNVLGKYISNLGYKQLRIAETTKYAHVTFFFNGGVEKIYKGEDRVLIPSPEVDTFDLKPEMSAYGISKEVIKRINSQEYNLIVLNYANCDMVGHSAKMEPTRVAVETVDKCLGQVVSAVKKQNGVTLITADHGNAEQLINYKTNGPMTSHTTNLVPFIFIDDIKVKLKKAGRLADIAPTILDIFGVNKPQEMTGKSLIKKN
jgi:2,3-bisphosphoglycerate-independent phosphoglycerate mutase